MDLSVFSFLDRLQDFSWYLATRTLLLVPVLEESAFFITSRAMPLLNAASFMIPLSFLPIICAARIAAFFAPALPTAMVATGTREASGRC